MSTRELKVSVVFDSGHSRPFTFNRADDTDMDNFRMLISNDESLVHIPVGDGQYVQIRKNKIAYIHVKELEYP